MDAARRGAGAAPRRAACRRTRKAIASIVAPSTATARSRRWSAPTAHHVGQAMARQGEDRLGIARADRARRPRAGGRASAVAAAAVIAASIDEARFGARARDGSAERLLEKGAQLAEPLAGERDARRHRMAAALDRQARLDRGAHRAAEIDAGDRAAGAGRMAASEREGEGRALEALLEPRRDAGRRRPAASSRPPPPPPRRAPRARATAAPRLRLRRAPRSRSAGARGSAGRVRRRSRAPRARRAVVSSRAPERRVADPAAGVDARADQEAQVIGARRPVGAGDVEQGGRAPAGGAGASPQALDDKGAVEPDERHDVGDRRQRHEIERGDEIGRAAAVRRSRSSRSARFSATSAM